MGDFHDPNGAIRGVSRGASPPSLSKDEVEKNMTTGSFLVIVPGAGFHPNGSDRTAITQQILLSIEQAVF